MPYLISNQAGKSSRNMNPFANAMLSFSKLKNISFHLIASFLVELTNHDKITFFFKSRDFFNLFVSLEKTLE